jgi:hypothetical protein
MFNPIQFYEFGKKRGVSFDVNALLLDNFPCNGTAFSLRKIKSSSIFCIKVRRTSDNTLQDIGFIGKDLDTNALTTFINGSDGYIHTWYDQSGSGQHAIQTLNANQPKIATSGSVILNGGKPAMFYNKSNKSYFNLSTSVFAGSFLDMYISMHTTSISTFGSMIMICGSPLIYWQLGETTQGYIQNTGISASYDWGNYYRRLVNLKSLPFSSYVNGVIMSTRTDSVVIVPQGTIPYTIGAYLNGQEWNLEGFMQELIIYKQEQTNRENIFLNMNNYYSIY